VRRDKAALSSGCTVERDVETEPWLNH
jgi:hypothetical protein